jgi:hypothetical protein
VSFQAPRVRSDRRRRTTEERFWWKVHKTTTCWLWRAALDRHGYGLFHPHGTHTVLAHRWAYQSLIGPIPEELEIDHLCRVRHCVNPAHMEPVTCGENVRRGLAARQAG